MKLIIDIPEELVEKEHFYTEEELWKVIRAAENGTPLDDVKAEIEQNAYPIVHGVNNHEKGMTLYGMLQVLDNIGKAESEDEECKSE